MRIFLVVTRFFFLEKKMRIFLEQTSFFLEQTRIFLVRTRFFLEWRRIFLVRTRIFLEQTRKFLEQTRIFVEQTRIFLVLNKQPATLQPPYLIHGFCGNASVVAATPHPSPTCESPDVDRKLIDCTTSWAPLFILDARTPKHHWSVDGRGDSFYVAWQLKTVSRWSFDDGATFLWSQPTVGRLSPNDRQTVGDSISITKSQEIGKRREKNYNLATSTKTFFSLILLFIYIIKLV